MMRNAATVLIAAACATVFSAIPASAALSTAGGGLSIYANPFDPSGNDTFTGSTFATDSPPWSQLVDGRNISNAYSRFSAGTDGGRSNGLAYVISGTSTPSTFMSASRAATFTAGTIIVESNETNGYFNGGSSPYSVSLLNGVTTVAGNVVSGTGALGTAEIKVVDLGSQYSVNSVRIDLGNNAGQHLTHTPGDANFYATIDEVTILPDRLSLVVPTNITVGSTTYGAAANVADLSGTTQSGDGWGDQSGNTSKFILLDFGSMKTLGALVLETYSNTAATLTVRDGANNIVGTVNAAAGEIIPLKFTSPLTTQFLRIETSGPDMGFREIIPLAVVSVPEPMAAGALGIFGVLAMARRSRRTIVRAD